MTARTPDNITEVLRIDADHPQLEILARAAELLRQGAVVAFPTETVYGLGANALDSAAVAEIFRAKGRPATNPLIVHIADRNQLSQVVADWPDRADKLADRFWPGPLTMILPKAAGISDLVTANGPTVAVRMPAHPVASQLIQISGLPLAAPSANRSMALSPTRAEHVLESLGGRIPLILDGGRTQAGIESTVIDLTTQPATLLRPGPISPALLEAIVGPLARTADLKNAGPIRSPGMMARHYAPRTPLLCVESMAEFLLIREEARNSHLRIGVVQAGSTSEQISLYAVETRTLPQNAAEYATVLYETLHDLDHAGLDRIIVILPPAAEDWLAIRDRLSRASAKEPETDTNQTA